MKPVEVTLPKCPVCGRVGRLPNQGNFSAFCAGPMTERHRRTKMEDVLFREVVELRVVA